MVIERISKYFALTKAFFNIKEFINKSFYSRAFLSTQFSFARNVLTGIVRIFMYHKADWKQYVHLYSLSSDENPDPMIFGMPDPDPLLFSPDPDMTFNGNMINFHLHKIFKLLFLYTFSGKNFLWKTLQWLIIYMK